MFEGADHFIEMIKANEKKVNCSTSNSRSVENQLEAVKEIIYAQNPVNIREDRHGKAQICS